MFVSPRLDPSAWIISALRIVPSGKTGVRRATGPGAGGRSGAWTSARFTAYVFCAGVLCGPCVAPGLPLGPVSSTARARSSRGPATVHRRRPRGPRLNEVFFISFCVLGCGSSPPTRVCLDARICLLVRVALGLELGATTADSTRRLVARRTKHYDYAFDHEHSLRHRVPAAQAAGPVLTTLLAAGDPHRDAGLGRSMTRALSGRALWA